jgi:hypothetical protein
MVRTCSRATRFMGAPVDTRGDKHHVASLRDSLGRSPVDSAKSDRSGRGHSSHFADTRPLAHGRDRGVRVRAALSAPWSKAIPHGDRRPTRAFGPRWAGASCTGRSRVAGATLIAER